MTTTIAFATLLETFGSLGFPGVQNCGNINELCPHVSV